VLTGIWSTPARLRGSGVHSDDVLAVTDDDEMVNEVRIDKAIPRVETSQILSSYNGACTRSERCRLGGAPVMPPGCSGAPAD
jgi:hypothetical protein